MALSNKGLSTVLVPPGPGVPEALVHQRPAVLGIRIVRILSPDMQEGADPGIPWNLGPVQCNLGARVLYQQLRDYDMTGPGCEAGE